MSAKIYRTPWLTVSKTKGDWLERSVWGPNAARRGGANWFCLDEVATEYELEVGDRILLAVCFEKPRGDYLVSKHNELSFASDCLHEWARSHGVHYREGPVYWWIEVPCE